MRTRFVTRQLAAAVMGGLYLSGCSSALTPASIPSGQQINDYYANDFYHAVALGTTPEDTLIIGTSYVDQRCSEFFDAVEQTSRKLEVAKTGFLTASNEIQTLMNLAKKSTLAIAQVAAAVEITKVILDEYQEQFTFAPHSVELRSLVFQALEKDRKDLENLIDLDRGAAQSSLTQVSVTAAIKRYADNCTLGRIREHWNNAIAKAVREGVSAQVPVDPNAAKGTKQSVTGRTPRSVLSVNRYVVR